MIWHFAFFDIALIAYSMPFNIEWSYNNIFFQGHPFILYSHHQCYTMSPFCLIFTIAILALWSTRSQTYCNCLSICSLDSVQYLLFKFFDIVNMHSSFIVVILAVCNGDRLLPVRLEFELHERLQLLSLSKIIYPDCSVLVGSRKGL